MHVLCKLLIVLKAEWTATCCADFSAELARNAAVCHLRLPFLQVIDTDTAPPTSQLHRRHPDRASSRSLELSSMQRLR